MPNTNDRKIIERLTNDSALEMKRHELEELLDTELSKPAEEIDARLVEELLAVLQPEEVPSGVKQKVWKSINKLLNPKPRKTHRVLQRLAAIAAIVVLLFGLTIGAAQAFRWTFLLKLLQPVAETFGIYMNYSDDQASDAVIENRYTISEDENTTVLHDDLSEIPDTYDGYAIKPGWLPDGYTFVQASSFVEILMEKYTIDYQRGEDELNIFVSIYPDSGTVSSHFYERTEEKVSERMIDSKMVTFYNNTDDEIQSVSWVDGNLHYSIIGDVTLDEIEKIVESFLINQAE